MTANQFAASGFFQSIYGQSGTSTAQSPSLATFLSGGTTSSSVTANYGYTTNYSGFFITQPIIVGVGVGGAGAFDRGGIGCGGGSFNGAGGNGLVIIGSL
jgi:hypothetical protein